MVVPAFRYVTLTVSPAPTSSVMANLPPAALVAVPAPGAEMFVFASTAKVRSLPSLVTVSTLAVTDLTFPLATLAASADVDPPPGPGDGIGRTEIA